MKNKHIFSLLDTSFTTVGVIFGCHAISGNETFSLDMDNMFDPEAPWEDARNKVMKPPPAPQGKQVYTFKVPYAWNAKVGDILVVPGKETLMSFVTVVRADETPDIDIDSHIDYKWAIQVVDRTEYDRLVDNEKRFGQAMLEVERVKQRETLVNSFRDSLPEGSEARRLFEQTTATLAPPTAPVYQQPPNPATWDGADAAADDNRSPMTDTGTA